MRQNIAYLQILVIKSAFSESETLNLQTLGWEPGASLMRPLVRATSRI
jgi:hypothetical protein